jgi:hypothetical protein
MLLVYIYFSIIYLLGLSVAEYTITEATYWPVVPALNDTRLLLTIQWNK